MQVVYVHKDISEYEEKVVGKLSARVAACVGGGIAASVAAAAFAHLVVGVEVADATMPVMMCSMPFWRYEWTLTTSADSVRSSHAKRTNLLVLEFTVRFALR